MRLAPAIVIVVIATTLGGGASAATAEWNYDIYAVRTDGRGATQLTSDPKTEMSPAVSPNGRRIVYVRGTKEGTAQTDLWIMNADGTDQRPLVATSDLEERPAWSPDGRWIAFSSITCDQLVYRCSSWRVFRVRPDGSGLMQVFVYGRNPLWSPDGERLAFEGFVNPYHEADSLIVTRPDGSGVREVAAGHIIGGLSWSADGRTLGFSTYDFRRDERRAKLLDVRSGRVRPLGNRRFVLFAPRGSSMLVGGSNGVFVVSPRRRPVRVPNGSGFAWSRRGARLAYELRHELFVVGADGRSRRRVLRFADDLPQLPPYDWSPDGRRIYLTLGTRG